MAIHSEIFTTKAEQNELNSALEDKTDLSDRAARQIIQATLRKYCLPSLNAIGTKQMLIECFRKKDERIGLLCIQARPFLGIPKYRRPLPRFDLAIVDQPGQRLTDASFWQGRISLFVVGTAMRAGAEQGNNSVRQRCERFGIEAYGIHTHVDLFEKPPLTGDALKAFLEKTVDPYSACGYSDTAALVRDEFDRPIRWWDYELPYLAVVDGEGLEVGDHFGPQITTYEFEETSPALIEEASKFHDWPVPGRPEMYERGRNI